MITQVERNNIVARESALKAYCVEQGFTNKRGWPSYKSDQVAHLNPPSNEERSAVEVFDFVTNPPDRYFLYINHDKRLATTWTGDKLGDVAFGDEYHCPAFGWRSTRVPVTIKAINGRTYYGTWFKSSGDYARIRAAKH